MTPVLLRVSVIAGALAVWCWTRKLIAREISFPLARKGVTLRELEWR